MTTSNNERILGLRQDYREQNNLIYKPAFLGDASGNYIDPNYPGYVIIRELTSNGLSQPRRAFLPANLSLVLKAGAPIKLGRDEFSREVVLGADSNNTLNAGINTVSTVQTVTTGSTAQGSVETLRCVAQSVPSLVVTVKGWAITTASGYTEFPGSIIDLTSHVPSSGNMRYAVIAVKNDYATLEAANSTPRLVSDLPLGPADVSEAVALLSAGSTSVWAIKLIGGQTEITQQDIDNDGKDLRQLVNTTVNGVTVQAVQIATGTVASTNSETTILSTVTGTKTLLANALVAGRTVRVTAWGIVSDTGTPTITLKIKFGSTVILTTGAVTLGSGISNKLWKLEGVITCRTIGSSGTVFAQGLFYNNGTINDIVNTATTTVDTTSSQVIDLTAQWSASSSSNTISCTNCLIEVLS